jgi:hypothetical protein
LFIFVGQIEAVGFGDLQCGEKRIAGRNAEESPVMPPTSVVSLHETLVSQGYKLIDDE